jgi:hypothetical protein
MLGATCIETQGTRIPSKVVIEMSDRCEDFTFQDLGRQVLRMSTQQMLATTRGGVTPLAKAWYAFDYLYDSPLRFDRKQNAEETSYAQIKAACTQLERDFNDDRKWSR